MRPKRGFRMIILFLEERNRRIIKESETFGGSKRRNKVI